MAVAEAHIKAHENLGQGLFGVQLEITAKLLEAEKKKLTQLQLFQSELEDDKSVGIDRAAEVERQKSNYARLSSQYNRLAKEYEDAARGLLRRSTKQKKSSRSLPSLGFKQTVKARPTIFGNIVQDAIRQDESKKEANKDRSPFFGPQLGCLEDFDGGVSYKDGRLMSGTLEALIKKLVPLHDYYPDRTYVFAFLLCCRLFVSPTVLLSRVSSACAETMKDSSPSNARKLGSNIVQLMSEWTDAFTNDFRDEVMMMHFKDITSYCASLSTDLKKMVGQVTQALFCKLAMLDKYDEVLTQANAAAEDRRRTNPTKYKSVLDVCADPPIMAQQLSHIEQERLANIGPEEFVETFISRDDADFKSTLNFIKRTRSLEAYVEWFNRLGYLVATEICLGNKKSVRAKKIDFFIEVANDCYDRGNFNSAMAIIAGMNMSPVARLKKTWSKVKNKKFDRLEREMNPMSNFSAYRTSFKAAHARKDEKNEYVIPFFGLFLKDVYFLNEGYNNRLPNGHINFEKFWQLSKVITEFVSWKETTISYERHGSILNYLMTAPLFSDNDLSLASYECEPPETNFEKERQKSLNILPDKKRGFGEEDYEKKRSKTLCIIMIIVLLVFLIGIILLIVGLVMLSTIPKCEKLSEKARYEAMCNPSSEAQENGFYKLLDKVQSFFYELYPDHIAYKRPVSVKEIREKFKVYDPSPAFKKNMTDRSRALLKEVNALNMNALKLTQREAKALSQLKHSLKYMFGYMYDTNYYAGDYMLGPNLWCRQPICDVGRHLSQTLRYFKPNTIEEMELLRDRLKGVKRAFSQYIENLKYGVKAGMVRTIEECNAGINGLTSKYRIISFQGEQGVFKEEFLKDIVSVKFLANLTNNEQNKWQLKYAKPVNGSLTEFILEFVGKPIASLFRYLRTEHPLHCVPHTVSSGLSFLPLSYVYVNGTADNSQPTTKRLPTGEILNGTKTYEMLVGAFTTTDMTPDEIYELGIEMLYKLYPEALKLAKKVTGKNDNDTAIELFLQKINSSEMFYNKEKLPANESDKNAFKMCSTAEDARKYCPKRWEAMQKMVGDILMFNSLIYPKIIKMFHFAGEKYTVPNCPLKIAPELNPSAGANYNIAGKDCLKSARYNVPFFKSRFGPKWSVLTVCAHEGRPGHHTQAQGKLERFGDTCGGTISWLGSLTFYTAFIEGWALYAESPLIAKETDIYEERPLQNFGVLKWQVWRALRLVVDSGLHSRRMSRQTAIEYFKNYTWDGGEMAEKEVTRYQSSFGQATSYMIGQQQIVKLRTYAQKELGSNFDLKDFHFYLLSQGSYPLNYAKEIVEQYVSCKKKDRPGCYDILNPPRAPDDSNFDQGVEGDMEYRYDPPQPRRETYYL